MQMIFFKVFFYLFMYFKVFLFSALIPLKKTSPEVEYCQYQRYLNYLIHPLDCSLFDCVDEIFGNATASGIFII